MQVLKTISGEEIKVSHNKKNRTFTIRINGSKYRTDKMDKIEFESCLSNTGNDWKYFLKSNCYSLIK